MADAKPVEIVCAACGKDTLLLRRPRYEGFTRVGEDLSCSACGHAYADEAAVPFKGRAVVQVFDESDRPVEVKVFREDEKHRLCRYCKHYLINPFTQWCSLHRKEVEATDACDRFLLRPEPPPETKDKPKANPLD